MKDLRVYVSPAAAAGAPGGELFYSRRADGPLYLWRCDGTPGSWSFSRVHPSRLALRALRAANWEALRM